MKAVVRKTARVQHRPAPRSNERRLVRQHPRRQILNLAAGAAALPFAPRLAWRQACPTRPVRISRRKHLSYRIAKLLRD
jgi:hypothetical protein